MWHRTSRGSRCPVVQDRCLRFVAVGARARIVISEMFGGAPARRRLRFRVAARVRAVVPMGWWTSRPGPRGADRLLDGLPRVGAVLEGALPAVLAGTQHVTTDPGSRVRIDSRGPDPFWSVATVDGASEWIADIDVVRRRPGRRWNDLDRAPVSLSEVVPRTGSLRGWDRAVRRVRRARRVEAGEEAAAGLAVTAWARAIVEFGAVGAALRAATLPADVVDLVGLEVASALRRNVDEDDPERAAVRVRRAVLSRHGPSGALARVAALAGVDAGLRVAVVMATMRPAMLDEALARIGAQDRAGLEVVVGCHGFAAPAGETRLANGASTRFVAVEASVPLGGVLDLLVRRTDAVVIVKWDDDDLYDPHHVTDLVHALECSRAEIVGKAAEFLWLEGRGVTLRRHRAGSERDSAFLAGSALAFPAVVVRDSPGGWPSVERGADTALIRDVLGRGGRAYRLHGLGHVAVRRAGGEGHTWHVGESALVASASSVHDGLDLTFAGFEVPLR